MQNLPLNKFHDQGHKRGSREGSNYRCHHNKWLLLVGNIPKQCNTFHTQRDNNKYISEDMCSNCHIGSEAWWEMEVKVPGLVGFGHFWSDMKAPQRFRIFHLKLQCYAPSLCIRSLPSLTPISFSQSNSFCRSLFCIRPAELRGLDLFHKFHRIYPS